MDFLKSLMPAGTKQKRNLMGVIEDLYGEGKLAEEHYEILKECLLEGDYLDLRDTIADLIDQANLKLLSPLLAKTNELVKFTKADDMSTTGGSDGADDADDEGADDEGDGEDEEAADPVTPPVDPIMTGGGGRPVPSYVSPNLFRGGAYVRSRPFSSY